jgi:hypothetical protein
MAEVSRVMLAVACPSWAWTAEDGSARSTVEVAAEELVPSLRRATATPMRATKPA